MSKVISLDAWRPKPVPVTPIGRATVVFTLPVFMNVHISVAVAHKNPEPTRDVPTATVLAFRRRQDICARPPA